MRVIKFRLFTSKTMIYSPLSIGFPVENTDDVKDDYGHSGVLMQFTGLRDYNGKEIYEGDVVKHHRGDLFDIAYVGHRFSIYPVEKSKSNITSHWDDAHEGWDEGSSFEFEVIGNIYENPELLSPTT